MNQKKGTKKKRNTIHKKVITYSDYSQKEEKGKDWELFQPSEKGKPKDVDELNEALGIAKKKKKERKNEVSEGRKINWEWFMSYGEN